jgi:hypothetical protein
MTIQMKKQLYCSSMFILATLDTTAQQSTSLDQKMADGLRGNGMMNVVLVCLAIVLMGLLVTVWRLDRKVSQLENNNKENKL